MIESNRFKEQLCQEIQELNTLQKKLQLQVSSMPKGTLHIHKKGNYAQYFVCDENRKRVYIPVEKRDAAGALAQKSYNERVLEIIQARQRAAEQLLKQYEQTVEEVYLKLSEARKNLVTPIVPTEEDFIRKWYEGHPGAANPYPNNSVIYSERGEAVRSKSEKILADLFFRNGIPYVYEPQILLSGGKKVYPDFLLLNVRKRKTYVYEHFGMMDNPEYARNMVERLNLYSANDYGHGDILLFSMETSISPLNTRCVERMLSNAGFHLQEIGI